MEETDKDKDPLSKEMIIKRLRFITIFTSVSYTHLTLPTILRV